MQPLNEKTLGRLVPSAARPDYDRKSVTRGIVHLGVGAFARAHQAVYTDSILRHDAAWGITGVSLKSTRTSDALAGQGCLYTVVARGRDGDSARVIGSIGEILVACQAPEAALAALVDPMVRVVTLTITEKGYCHDPATGRL
ncbi:MAG: mannitol dehydrogenase family protein, partial [Hyphomicrobiales bacterium]